MIMIRMQVETGARPDFREDQWQAGLARNLQKHRQGGADTAHLVRLRRAGQSIQDKRLMRIDRGCHRPPKIIV